MDSLSLREVRESDTVLLAATCWPESDLTVIEARIHNILRWMKRGRGIGLTALVNDHPIGYGQVIFWRDHGEISDLVVAENFRGSGIGTAILSSLINFSRESGVRELEIGVEEHNERAYRLYRRTGFIDSGKSIENDGAIIHYLVMEHSE